MRGRTLAQIGQLGPSLESLNGGRSLEFTKVPVTGKLSIFVVFIALSTLSQMAYSLGVNAQAVTKWSVTKLCEQKGRYKHREFDAQVAILGDEIAKRDISAADCEKLGAEWIRRNVNPRADRFTRKLAPFKREKFNAAVFRVFDKYGPQLETHALGTACSNESINSIEPNWAAINEYALRMITSRDMELAPTITNYISAYYKGYRDAMKVLAKKYPAECTDEALSLRIEGIESQ